MRDALLALALLLLLRCVLDTWDAVYYPLPFVLALLAWEVRGPGSAPAGARAVEHRARVGQLPVAPAHVSPDAQAAFFLAWSLPLAAVLGRALSRRRAAASGRVRARRSRARSGDDRERLGQAAQDLLTVLGDDHEVLDPHAQAPGR